MNKVMTIADLMTILCDCVDSGTLEIYSEVFLYSEGIDCYNNKVTIICPVNIHDIFENNGKKCLRLRGSLID